MFDDRNTVALLIGGSFLKVLEWWLGIATTFFTPPTPTPTPPPPPPTQTPTKLQLLDDYADWVVWNLVGKPIVFMWAGLHWLGVRLCRVIGHVLVWTWEVIYDTGSDLCHFIGFILVEVWEVIYWIGSWIWCVISSIAAANCWVVSCIWLVLCESRTIRCLSIFIFIVIYLIYLKLPKGITDTNDTWAFYHRINVDRYCGTMTCTICQRNLWEPKGAAVAISCKHMFHHQCIRERKRNCPLCRKAILPFRIKLNTGNKRTYAVPLFFAGKTRSPKN